MKRLVLNKAAIGAVIGLLLATIGSHFGVDLADQQEAIGTGLGLLVGGVWTCVERVRASRTERRETSEGGDEE